MFRLLINVLNVHVAPEHNAVCVSGNGSENPNTHADHAVTLYDAGFFGCQNAITLHYSLQNLFSNGRGVHEMDFPVNFDEKEKNMRPNLLRASMCSITMSNKTEPTHDCAIRLCGNSTLLSVLCSYSLFVVQRARTKIAKYFLMIAAVQ